ncbi:MAG: FixH family protein [Gammaproteobacteria bacterium]|nr:FixH family protein [Gammaproteobacteria bacterium]
MLEFLFKYSAHDYDRGELVFTGDWPTWLIIGLVAVAAIGIAFVLLRRRSDTGPAQLITVGLMQFAVVLIVLAMLQQPALKTEALLPGENTLALVLDSSASMRYGSGASRLETGRDYVADAETRLASLAISIQRFELADTASSVTSFAESQAVGGVTSIADSLLTVLGEARSSSLAAIVLISDGIDTSGGISAEQLGDIASFAVPIHTIAVGRETMPEDLELTQVLIPSTALPGSTVSARVSIRHDAPGATRVKVYDGDELLASDAVQLQPGVTTTSVRIDIEQMAAGHRQLSFSVDALPDERELRNNNRETLVNVAADTHRILYFEGEPRWEYKFLRRAIAGDEEINLISLLSVSPNKFYRQGLESAEQLEDGFPASREELFAYDALIIGSVQAATFTPEQLSIIRDFVSERGGSLLLLAGPNGLGNGGWGQSAIADLLPARLPPSATNTFVRKKATPALTPQGADLQMLRLANTAADNRSSWDGLPDVADYQQTGRLKPAATTLLTVSTDAGPVPLLITQPFGRGHTYILATGGTWRWQMSLPVEDQRHETFWRQFLRALVASAPATVSVSADTGASTLKLRAEFRDKAFDPVTDLNVSAAVSHEAGESQLVELAPSPAEPGVYLAEIDSATPGTWYVEAVANRDGEPFGIARASTYADPGQAEYFNIRANAGLLQRLSDATGGQHLDPDDIGALTELVRYSDAGIKTAVYRPIWDAPILFLLLLALKSGEWLLRRRWRSI